MPPPKGKDFAAGSNADELARSVLPSRVECVPAEQAWTGCQGSQKGADRDTARSTSLSRAFGKRSNPVARPRVDEDFSPPWLVCSIQKQGRGLHVRTAATGSRHSQ